MPRLTFIFMISLTILSSCVSNPPPKGALTRFQTHISSSGLKHFQASFQLKKNRSGPQPSHLTRRSERNSHKGFKDLQKKLREYADNEIEQNKFCLSGYWVVENAADAHTPYLRGECNETASKEDRDTFPNSDFKW